MTAAQMTSAAAGRALAALKAIVHFPQHPILIRDVRVQLRSGRTLRILAGQVLLLAAALVLLHLTRIDPLGYQTKETLGVNPARVYETGQIFRMIIYGANLLIAVLLAATLPLSAIARERSQRALEYLQLTPLSPFGIVLAEVAATMAVTGAVMLFSLPMLLISGLYGDVMLGATLRISLYCLLTVLLIGSLGCLFGAAAKRALRSQGLLIAALLFFLYLSAVLLAAFPAGITGYFLPMFAAVQEMTQELPPPLHVAGGLAVPQWAVSSAFTMILSAFLLLGASRKLYRPEAPVLSPLQFLLFYGLSLLLIHALSWRQRQSDWQVAFGAMTAIGLLPPFALALPFRRADAWQRKRAWLAAALIIAGSAALMYVHLGTQTPSGKAYAIVFCLPFLAFAALADQMFALGRVVAATRQHAIVAALALLIAAAGVFPVASIVVNAREFSSRPLTEQKASARRASGFSPAPTVLSEYFLEGEPGMTYSPAFHQLALANTGQTAALAGLMGALYLWRSRRLARRRQNDAPRPEAS